MSPVPGDRLLVAVAYDDKDSAGAGVLQRRRRLRDNNEETTCYGDDECCDSNIYVESTPPLVTTSLQGCFYSGVKRTGAAAF